MLYVNTSLIVPPNTPYNNPVTAVLKPGSPFVQSIDVFFPPGCSGLVWIRFKSTYHELSPFIRGDGRGVSIPVTNRLEEPYEIIAEAYSLAIDWTHTLELQVNYLPVRPYYHARTK